jgi:uncharacterized membrane protein SirB2
VTEHFLSIRSVHVAAALASGGLFLLRGIAMWRGSSLGMAAPVRLTSYAIDTVLLGAAVLLASMLHRVPFVDRWPTTKLGLVPGRPAVRVRDLDRRARAGGGAAAEPAVRELAGAACRPHGPDRGAAPRVSAGRPDRPVSRYDVGSRAPQE